MSIPGVASGLAYNATIQATGGSGKGYQWSLSPSSGTLPSGFTFSSEGSCGDSCADVVLSTTGSPVAQAGLYGLTVEVTDSVGNLAAQLLNLDISCSLNGFTSYPGLPLSNGGYPTTMNARFRPIKADSNAFGLASALQACNYVAFDWQQQITSLACTVWHSLPSGLPSGNLCQDGQAIFAPPAFYDSPGFNLNGNHIDSYPNYYPWSVVESQETQPSPLGSFCINPSVNAGNMSPLEPCIPLVSPDDNVLAFFDQPVDPHLADPMVPPSLDLPFGSYVGFTTKLVAMDQQGLSHTLNNWNWLSDYNGSSGGVLQFGSINPNPLDPGNGTGGITITSINGVPTPGVTVTPSPTNVSTAQGMSVAVVVNGASGSPTPTGSVTLSSGDYVSSATTLSGGAATISIPEGSLATGIDTLTAFYTPDNAVAATFSASSGLAQVTVGPSLLTPTVAVTPGSTNITTAQTLSVTVTVSGGSGNPSATGTVTLSGGGYASAITSLSGGSATILIPANSLSLGNDTLTADYTPDSNSSSTYNSTTGSGPVTVQGVPTLSWAAPAAITYGTALTGLQLNAVASVAGTFAYSPGLGTVPGAGSSTLSVTFTPADATDYTIVLAKVTLQVNKATPVIAWSPAPLPLGSPLGAAQLDATANVSGSFVYTPPTGTVIATSSQMLSALFTPTDTNDYNTANLSVPLTVITGPLAGVSSSRIDFGTVYLGTIATRNVTVTNLGNAPLTIADPFISILQGGNSNEFVAVNVCPKSLAPQKSCAITVGFVAGPFYKQQTATLRIVDNAPGNPQTVILTATVIDPQASLLPGSLNFGSQTVNNTVNKAVLLKNTGATTLSNISVTVKGMNASAFVALSNCGSTLTPGTSCTIGVSFKPVARTFYSATLQVTDNTKSGTQAVALSGAGH